MKNGKETEKGTYNEKEPGENAKNTRKTQLHTNWHMNKQETELNDTGRGKCKWKGKGKEQEAENENETETEKGKGQ